MRKVSIIPSLLTLCNLMCGLGSVWYSAKAYALYAGGTTGGWFTTHDAVIRAAAWLIFVGMIFDVLDGRIARLLNSTSNFGKELDSLADFLTFGIAPAMLINVASFESDVMLFIIGERGRMMLSAAYVIFAALRLARYNVQAGKASTRTDIFKGLPSPAAAGMAAAIVLMHYRLGDVGSWAADSFRQFSPVAAFLLGLLMVSGISFVHLGNSFLRSGPSVRRLAIFASAVLLLVVFPVYVLFSVFMAYIIVGCVTHLRHKALGEDEEGSDESPEGSEP